jgi:thiol-disulfide isomerase/thioredoxin
MVLFFFFLIGFQPSSYAEAPVLMQQKKSTKGWLGVRFQESDQETSRALGFSNSLIEVGLVVKGSPASHYGVLTGDVFSHVDGVRVQRKEDFIEQIQGKGAGELIRLTRVRTNGEQKTEEVTVMLAARPAERELQKNMFIGQPAPSFSYVDFETRTERSFVPEKGKVVLLDFWATWCGPCLMSMPDLRRIHKKYADRGLDIIGITDEPEAKIRPVARRFKIPYTLGSNRSYDAFQTYVVQALPTAYLIDSEGVIQEVFIGGGHMDELEKKIVALLPEQ